MSADRVMAEIQQLIRQEIRALFPFGIGFAKITGDATTTDTVNGVTVTLCKGWMDGDPEDTAHKVDLVVTGGVTPTQNERWVVLWTSMQPRVGMLLQRYSPEGGEAVTIGSEIIVDSIKFDSTDQDIVLYRGGSGFAILRRFGTDFTLLQIWSPTNALGAKEATLAVVRGDEPNVEYFDLYNNGYSTETQHGIRVQKRGTGQYRAFVFDFYDGSNPKVKVAQFDYDGTIVAWRFEKYMQVGKVSALPTASADYRGMMIRVEGGAGVADAVYICVKNAADAYEWHQIY